VVPVYLVGGVGVRPGADTRSLPGAQHQEDDGLHSLQTTVHTSSTGRGRGVRGQPGELLLAGLPIGPVNSGIRQPGHSRGGL
jgi:hypothetical protein